MIPGATFNSGNSTGGVRVRLPKSESEAENVLTGSPVTTGYKPSIPQAYFTATRGQAFLPSMLADVEAMLIHPVVLTPYAYYKSAIQTVKFKVKASSSAVGSFVVTELQKFWGRCLDKVQDGYDYGWLCGELNYEYDRGGLLGLHSLDTFHPLDCWALTVDDRYVGASVLNVPQFKERATLWGPDEGMPAKAFWYAHNRRWDRYYGRSQLYGAWRPWRRLAHRDGAEEVIDGGVYRFAYRGPIMRFPVKAFARADGGVDYDGARNKAREFVENAKAGVGLALPNSRDEKGEYEWVLDWPDHTINVSSLVEYAKYLEAQVSLGVGVPMELLQASDTGSGWSGRKVPMLGFYQSQEKNAKAILVAWKFQIGDKLVEWNFGPDAWFEASVELKLPSGMSDEQQQGGMGGAMPPPMPPPPPGGDAGGLAGMMGGAGGGEMSTLGEGEGDEVNHLTAATMRAGGRQKRRLARRAELARTFDLATEYVEGRGRNGQLIGVNPQDPTDKIYGQEAQAYFARKRQAQSQTPAQQRAARQQQGQQHRERAQKLAGQGKPAQAREAARRAQEGGADPGPKVRGELERQAAERHGQGGDDGPEQGESVDWEEELGDGAEMEEGKPVDWETELRSDEENAEQKALDEWAREKGGDLTQHRRQKKSERVRRARASSVGGVEGAVAGLVESAAEGLQKMTKFGANLNDATKSFLRDWYAEQPKERRGWMRFIGGVASAIMDFVPANILSRMAGEVSDLNKQDRQAAQAAHRARVKKGLGSAEGDDEYAPEKNQVETVSEWIDTGMEVASSGIDGLFSKMLSGVPFVGKAVELLESAWNATVVPIGSLVFLGYSAVTKPGLLIQAGWNTLRRNTQRDKLRRKEWQEADEEGNRRDETRPGRAAAAAAANTALGFELASDKKQGRLYPGLRRRIRMAFEGAKDKNWAMALFMIANDIHRDDPEEAVAAAEEALEKNPTPPAVADEDVDPTSWFNIGKGQSEEDGDDEGDDETELSALVADSVWVLGAPELCSADELADLQHRLRAASPAALAMVRLAVREAV